MYLDFNFKITSKMTMYLYNKSFISKNDSDSHEHGD